VLLPFFMTLGVWLLARGRAHGPSLLLAGLVLGVGLYSYAFARLLVPLLLAGFVALWWRDLLRQWRWSLTAVAMLLLLAVPIVRFGMTPEGQARLQAVVPLDRYRGLALVPYVVGNFLSYFRPDFLLWGTEPTHHHRLDGFAPVLPLMIPLVVAAIVAIASRPSRSALFCLWWIVAAPATAALHRESPSSVLLLGAIPAWQLLSGLGCEAIVSWVRGWRREIGLGLAGLLILASILTAGLVARALVVEYPVYAAEDWLHGSRESIGFLESRRSAYDDVLVSDRLSTPHILVLFYAAVDPALYQHDPIHVRQPNVRSRGEIEPYQFGHIQDLLGRPGRHLVWVSAGEGRSLFGEQMPLLTVSLPDGRPTQLVYEVVN
jgi:hypothetical protein